MTSYHSVNVVSTINELSRIDNVNLDLINLNDVDDKVQVEFEVEVGDVRGYVYAWKEYRVIGRREQIEFHIGAIDWIESMVIKEYIVKELMSL
jgi:hypothetical protein